MDNATIQAVVDRAFALGADAEVTFAFQGGEPTCAGLDFFRSFCAYVDEHRTQQTVHLAIQTNDYVINDTWAVFLAEHHFLVGVSIDGYPEMHDWLRPDARGVGTMARVLDAVAALRRAGVDFNILTVLTDQLAHHPQKLYRFYKQHKFDFVQLIPCLPGLDEESDEHSLEPESFASFYKTFFRLWLEDFKRGDRMSVTLFDNVIPLFRACTRSNAACWGRVPRSLSWRATAMSTHAISTCSTATAWATSTTTRLRAWRPATRSALSSPSPVATARSA